MHELSVSSAVVDTVLKHAAGRRVTVVSLRIGHLRQVVPDSLAFYFELVSRETLCEGARLEQEYIAGAAALRAAARASGTRRTRGSAARAAAGRAR